jgi:hypothetical protein
MVQGLVTEPGDLQLPAQLIGITVTAELLDGDQMLNRGDAQLRDQLTGWQQGAQRHQYGTDSGECDRDQNPVHAVGHDQPDPATLADAPVHEHGREP